MPEPYRDGCGTSGAQLPPLVADSARIEHDVRSGHVGFLPRSDWPVCGGQSWGIAAGVLRLVVHDDGGDAAGGSGARVLDRHIA